MRAVAALVVLAGLGLGKIDAASVSLAPFDAAGGTAVETFAGISALPPEGWTGDRSTASPPHRGHPGRVTSGGITCSGGGHAPRAGPLDTPIPGLAGFATADAVAALHENEAGRNEAGHERPAMRDVPLPTGFWLIGAALIGLFTYGRVT